MRLLVTGVTGLIGRHLIARANELGATKLFATARSQPADLPTGAIFVPADLSDPIDAAGLVRSIAPTHILHAAWETQHPTYWEDPSNVDWAISTGCMAEAFGEVGGQRFVQIGSCAEYDWSHEICIENETVDLPLTRYGKAKLAAFRLVEAAAHERFETVEARIFFVYGPGENPARLIPSICRSHLKGQTPQLGSGRQRRDLLFADDAATALLALVAQQGLQGIVNIGSGTETPLAEVAYEIARLTGATDSGVGLRPDRPHDPERLIPNTNRLRSIGWTPTRTLSEGLAETLDWWRRKAEFSN